MSNLTLTNEINGRFFLSNYGLYDALFFEGDENFLRKAQNFCINCGISLNYKFFNYRPNLMYCLAPKERILKGFIEQFKLDLFINSEDRKLIKLEYGGDEEEIKYDEEMVEKLGNERGTKYYESLEQCNLLNHLDKNELEFYEISERKNLTLSDFRSN